MLTVVILTCVAASPQAGGSAIAPEDFPRLIANLHEQVRDLSLIFEGEAEYVGEHPSAIAGEKQPPCRFQGVYAIRSDGATLLEVFERESLRRGMPEYFKAAILRGRLETIAEPWNGGPDSRDARRVQGKPGGPGSLLSNHSPEFYNHLWNFWPLRSVDGFGYEFRGWEIVDDVPCARIKINRTRGSTQPNPSTIEYWMDVNRGPNPLRIEFRRHGDLIVRVDRIKLHEVELPDGGRVWLPMSAQINRYDWHGEYFEEPVVIEKNYVVQGSTRVNQSLPDGVFSVRGTGLREVVEGGASRQLQQAYRKERPARPPEPTDTISVKKRLDEQLKLAEGQAVTLDASNSAETGWWNATTTLQVAFGFAGIFLVGTAIRLRMSSR